MKVTACRAGTRTVPPTPSHICFLLDGEPLGKEPVWVISSLRLYHSRCRDEGCLHPPRWGSAGQRRGNGRESSDRSFNPILAASLLSGLGHLLSLRLGVHTCESGVIVLARRVLPGGFGLSAVLQDWCLGPFRQASCLPPIPVWSFHMSSPVPSSWIHCESFSPLPATELHPPSRR